MAEHFRSLRSTPVRWCSSHAKAPTRRTILADSNASRIRCTGTQPWVSSMHFVHFVNIFSDFGKVPDNCFKLLLQRLDTRTSSWSCFSANVPLLHCQLFVFFPGSLSLPWVIVFHLMHRSVSFPDACVTPVIASLHVALKLQNSVCRFPITCWISTSFGKKIEMLWNKFSIVCAMLSMVPSWLVTMEFITSATPVCQFHEVSVSFSGVKDHQLTFIHS